MDTVADENLPEWLAPSSRLTSRMGVNAAEFAEDR